MPRQCEDLIGREFGRLKVVARASDYIRKDGRKEVMWECECSCGNPNTIVVMSANLRRKNKGTQSCGCIGRELSSKRAKQTITELHRQNHKVNQYDLSGEYGIGYTLQGDVFWFDKADYELIKDYCWHYNKRGYVVAWSILQRTEIKLHRLVMNVNNPNIEIDHIIHPPRNEHKIDNRKSNLRLVSHTNNTKNHVVQINNSSGTSGVHFSKRDGKWVARISCDGVRIHLGSFDTKEDAIRVRKEAESKYYGEYRYDASNTTTQNDLSFEEVI